jgi:hypothetical protein
MKRVIFTVWDDIEKEVSGPTEIEAKNIYNMDVANTLLVHEYFDRLVANKEEYARSVGATFVCFMNEMKDFNIPDEMEFTKVNLYKHHLMAELAKEYDEVLYVDMDVVFNTNLNIFEEHDLSKGIHIKDQDEDILAKEKERVVLSRVGKRAPTLKYFITKDLLDGKENHVMNTGIMIGKSEHIKQIKFIERIQEVKDKIQLLKEEPFVINKHYYANNESIFSYILEKYRIPYVLLDESWHKLYDNRPFDKIEGHCIHFINKQFNGFFNDKTKAIFSLHIDISKDKLDNPRSYEDTELSKSEIAKNQFLKYKDSLLDNHNNYANSIGADYIHFGKDADYIEFSKRFPDLTEYDIINLYKIYLLEKLTKQYDLVMYVDLDVYFRNHCSIFNSIPANYAICCLYDTKQDLKIIPDSNYFKTYVRDFRSPETKYWNTHALLAEDDLNPDNYVFNTGVVVASNYCMEKLDYFSDIEETIALMKELKEDEFSMYPDVVRESFGYDNETIFSYKIKKNDVPFYKLNEWWHQRNYYKNSKAMLPNTNERSVALNDFEARCKEWNTTIIHFISKNFGLVFDE